MTFKVLGIDPSLTSTGLAGICWTDTIKPRPKLRGPDRLLFIRQQIVTEWLPATLVAIEGPSYGSQAGQSGHHERAGLWWMVRCALHTHGVPVAVIPPASVKKYATGRGNAAKADMVREVTKRFPWFDGGEDEADALVLAAMAADHLGQAMAQMPATHRVALDAVTWPEMPAPLVVPYQGGRHTGTPTIDLLGQEAS